ncbi:hypothetical protein [Phyllobacterium sp. SB3]|uniref:hypothetical protein n=1 Tax=Phyllobacterium sp. SB3 TaxID=3156073 RepID=UPI0032AF27C4
MIRAAIVGPLTEVEYESPEERHAHCMEVLRDRFLERVSTREMLAIADEAQLSGWSFTEVRRAIDALVIEQARKAGAETCDETSILQAKSAVYPARIEG